ncbi:MAG: alpha-1,4-glucan--maltose-1-phosphate maltosyltransferase [Acidobacteriaceae bacterium]
MKPVEGRKRVIIEEIQPQVDCGRYPARRIAGDRVDISAAIFSDGHDHVSAQLLYKHDGDTGWHVAPMTALPNDLWTASFTVDRLGLWTFTIRAWVDHFDTWCDDLRKRLTAQTPPPRDPATSTAANPDAANPPSSGSATTPQDIAVALEMGAGLVDGAVSRASGADAANLCEIAKALRWMASRKSPFYEYPLSPAMEELIARYPDHSYAAAPAKDLHLWVDRRRARFSAWYELFPRSTSPDPSRHGTLRDVEALLPEIAAMGFDILYLPPIHPIGRAFRKGPNNSVTAGPDDEGSPWAIGAADGGHKAIHAKLGTLEDFDHLVKAAHTHRMELAMDIAFQCSPDHPWVKEHPEWFIHRPDGTIQYAENPPKKYQDIYPLNFESSDWRGLWDELCSVFQFWIDRGVRVFRVDNPHTKALPFWEWCINSLLKNTPEVIFLAEAFTRPHIMYSLAKGGFTQSYTYFTWRTQAAELQAYFEEITQPPVSDFFTPNVWPNTPDILHASLQTGGRAAFMQRLVLATTLAASYGIYGPAYELGENLPAKPGSEEYLDSEKYQIRRWDRAAAHSLAPLVTRLNNIRRANPALQSDGSLRFHHVDNPQILCYSKSTIKPTPPTPLKPVPAHAASTEAPPSTPAAPTGEPNVILTVVNLDPQNEQAGWIDLDLGKLGIGHGETFDVEDLLTGIHYQWHDRSNYVALRPDVLPAHVFRVTRLP